MKKKVIDTECSNLLQAHHEKEFFGKMICWEKQQAAGREGDQI